MDDIDLVYEPAIYLGYDKSKDEITFKCYRCGKSDTCPGQPSNNYRRCSRCDVGLILYDYIDWQLQVKEQKRKKERIAKDIIPFIASFVTVAITYLFLLETNNSPPFGVGTGIVLTIVGGFVFSFAYYFLLEYHEEAK